MTDVVLIDQTTPKPNGNFGDDAFDAFAKCNENFTALGQADTAEAQVRAAADQALAEAINALPTSGALQDEVNARVAADNALGVRIDGSATAAALAAEVTARGDADTLLQQAIATEATARTNADNALSTAITAVLAKTAKNRFLNGDFRIWQDGTTFAAAQAYYSADGWLCSNGVSTGAISRFPFANSQAQIPGNPKYFLRYTLTSTAGVSNYATLRQRIEGVTTLAGQTVTVSFWVRANAARQISIEFAQRTGNAGEVNAIGVRKFSVSTSWEKKTATVVIPIFAGSDVGTDLLEFLVWLDAGSQYNPRTDSLGIQGSGVIDFAQFQLEKGDTATDFEFRDEALELVMCQRYFEIVPMWGTTGVTYTPNGDTRGAAMAYKVTKRAQPSFTRRGTLNVLACGSEGSVINVDLGTVSINGSTGHCWVSGVSNISGIAPAGAVVTWGDNRTGALSAVVDARL